MLFRVRFLGTEHLPGAAAGRAAGGWICCALPHRTWVEPLLLLALLPAEPRLIVLGDGRTIFRSPLRRLLATRVGGVVPIWSGSGRAAFAGHVEAARRTVAAGAVFCLFPEVGPPVRMPELRRLSPGVAYLALRTGAPIVPVVFGGTDSLYLRRRIEVRLL
ncbi:MAG TPA: 1-acyl-sn-glycerol-3-phosphate acyltransferase, partial [Candidatus Caenarcaniphilales bacterium]|nr:1-acyl-sn-glycerol-3-phosphate acyltransferase [Candidatus Caenarcaniphilales bacterium]